MKKMIYSILIMLLFMINIKAEVIVTYDKAVKYSQSYIYKLSKHDKYILTSTRFNEITGSTSIIPYSFSNKKLTTNNTFLSGGILTEDEFNISKDKDGYTYLVKDVEFFLMKNTSNKAVDILRSNVVEAYDKKYGLRVTYFTVPEVKVKGTGSSVEPFEFVGTNKLTFYIENGKITNGNSNTNKYIVYALESDNGSVIINFEPNTGYEYLSNNCGFEYKYNEELKIHSLEQENKNITSDQDCSIKLKTNGLTIEYDLNGGSGTCDTKAVHYGKRIGSLCKNITKEGYTFVGWKDSEGNIVTSDDIMKENLKLHAEFKANKPSATLTVTDKNGKKETCNSETCTLSGEYHLPITVNVNADGNGTTVKEIKMFWNAGKSTSYSDAKYGDEVLGQTNDGNKATASRVLNTYGKRTIKVVVTNKVNETTSITVNIDIPNDTPKVAETFEEEYKCTKTVVTAGDVVAWRANSTCHNTEQTDLGCGWYGKEYFGVVKPGVTICISGLINEMVFEERISANVYVKGEDMSRIGTNNNGNALQVYGDKITVIYDGETYYHLAYPLYCNGSNCGYKEGNPKSGWVISGESRTKVCDMIKNDYSSVYNKLCN